MSWQPGYCGFTFRLAFLEGFGAGTTRMPYAVERETGAAGLQYVKVRAVEILASGSKK
jgi:hypothetical protein